MSTTIEQAAHNLIRVSCWHRPEQADYTAPFPWRCIAAEGHVTIMTADDQVLLSDETGEADPAFWAAFISALNSLAVETQRQP